MILYSYAMRNDTGFAPNPFHSCCTLGVCTPNHQGARIQRGHWILGNANVARGHGMIYVMEVSDIIEFDDYYNHPDYQAKKPRFDRTWLEACGDNVYQRVGRVLVQQASLFHTSQMEIEKDIKHPVVYVGSNFFYFGSKTPELPGHLQAVICKGRGVRCRHEPELVTALVRWLKDSFMPGVHGEPWDRRKTERALAQKTTPQLHQIGFPVPVRVR